VSCGPSAAADRAANVDLSSQALIQGTVVRGEEPVKGAYVRLLDASGEFTAEVPTGESGVFRFFAGAGTWTVRVLARGSEPVERRVHADLGTATEVEVSLT
jgi:uncharacterized protein DUF1416